MSAPDGAYPPMKHHSYLPTSGVTHRHPQPSQGLWSPQGPPPQHKPQYHYAMTHVINNNHYHHGYPPPAPMYAQPPGHGPATSSDFNSQSKKQTRATQACEQCRHRKQKCDEGTPCSSCKDNDADCQYRDTPPAKTDKNMDKVIALTEQISQGNQDLRQDLADRLSAFDARLRGMKPRDNSASIAVTPNRESQSDKPVPNTPQELKDHRTGPHNLIRLVEDCRTRASRPPQTH